MVGSMIGTALSSAISASPSLYNFGLNQFSSALNSHRAWKYAKKAMALQDKYNRNMIRDYYSLNRESLVNANYNPLLAVPGSTAQGASYSPTMMNADSDAGDQAVNSAISAIQTKSELKTQKLQQENLDLQNKHQKLENEKLRNENATSARNIIGNVITGNDDPTVNKLKQSYGKIKETLKTHGIDLPDLPVENVQPSSALSSVKKRSYLIPSDKYTYVQKGVPRSVIKNFEKAENKHYKVKYVNSQKKNNSSGRPKEVSSKDWYGYVSYKNVDR